MNFLHVIVLGAVEGFTEFLPISSTAHLVLVSKLLHIQETDFLKSFIITIQLGAILAVTVLFWKKLLHEWEVNKRVIAAFVPTAVVGFVLYKLIKGFFLENTMLILLMLFVGGLGLIVFERFYLARSSGVRRLAEMSYGQALCIGLAQAVAVVPGVSRAAATIVAGMLVGVDRAAMVEFSFLLAIPTMAAATGYDLLKSAHAFSAHDFYMLAVGFVASFFFAIIGIRFFMRYVQRHSLSGFGAYRIAAALLFLLLLEVI